MAKNPFGKTVKPEQAYAVYSNGGNQDSERASGAWTWYVLKMYQAPAAAIKNPYARAFCFVTSPIVPSGEYGDTYLHDIGGELVQGVDVRAGKEA